MSRRGKECRLTSDISKLSEEEIKVLTDSSSEMNRFLEAMFDDAWKRTATERAKRVRR